MGFWGFGVRVRVSLPMRASGRFLRRANMSSVSRPVISSSSGSYAGLGFGARVRVGVRVRVRVGVSSSSGFLLGAVAEAPPHSMQL